MGKRIAVLHPGEMGVTIGACAKAAGQNVGWAVTGRSAATLRRAEHAGLENYASVEELITASDVVISVCPPAAATELATTVSESGFNGIYVDANAIAPHTAVTIARTVEDGGATYVDGGIVGPPAHTRGTTRLYLSGTLAANVAACFTGAALEAIDIGDSPSAASALKMCYAAWTKGSAALLLAVGALARAEHVESALHSEWERSLPDLTRRLETAATRNAPKAWRFEGEMREIADTFEARGLTGDFHRAAAETFALLSEFKDIGTAPGLDEVLTTLLASSAAR